MFWREGERGEGRGERGGEGGGEVHAVLPDRLWRMSWFCGPLTVCVSVSVCLCSCFMCAPCFYCLWI